MRNEVREAFQNQLLRYSQEADAARRERLEGEIWAAYGMEQAVLVVDMSGFSQLTNRHGIVHYLSMVRRMQLTAEPIIHGFGGTLIKFEADNCFAMFPEVRGAIRAAVAMNLAFAAANRMTPDELDIRIACGIDHGRILVIDRGDFFGDPVNRASKLGEDLAAPGEVLITRCAFEHSSSEPEWQGRVQRFSVSGLHIDALSLHVPETGDLPPSIAGGEAVGWAG